MQRAQEAAQRACEPGGIVFRSERAKANREHAQAISLMPPRKEQKLKLFRANMMTRRSWEADDDWFERCYEIGKASRVLPSENPAIFEYDDRNYYTSGRGWS